MGKKEEGVVWAAKTPPCLAGGQVGVSASVYRGGGSVVGGAYCDGGGV